MQYAAFIHYPELFSFHSFHPTILQIWTAIRTATIFNTSTVTKILLMNFYKLFFWSVVFLVFLILSYSFHVSFIYWNCYTSILIPSLVSKFILFVFHELLVFNLSLMTSLQSSSYQSFFFSIFKFPLEFSSLLQFHINIG